VRTQTPTELLSELRARADEDFSQPGHPRAAGRHQVELIELGLRVACTRSRYPKGDGEEDLYAVTVSRLRLDGRPSESEISAVLGDLFGATAAAAAQPRPAGELVSMFRIPFRNVSGEDSIPVG